jgi:hypothetical protein
MGVQVILITQPFFQILHCEFGICLHKSSGISKAAFIEMELKWPPAVARMWKTGGSKDI